TPDRQLDSDDDGEGDACDPDDGLVQGLRMDGTLLIWEPEADADAYNLYRGELGADLFVSLSDCRIDGTTATFSIDTEAPVLGDGFVYLVSRTAGGAEGSLGLKSDGRNRLVDVPCP
ncbi:MAG: hypothetical protein OEO77_15320, partial [Acidimicrobiia bacterium]|nr:hypothetical protein [Acidimicrobiia bacterium]